MKDFAKSIVCNTKAEAEKVGNFEDPKKAKYYIEMWERRRDDAKRSLQNAEGHLKEAMKHRYGDKEFNQREVQRYQEAVKAAEATIKQYDDLIKSAAKTSFGNTRTGNSYSWTERRGHQELYDPAIPFGGHVRGYVEKTKNGYVGAKTNGSIIISQKEFATEEEAKKFVENKQTGNTKVGNGITKFGLGRYVIADGYKAIVLGEKEERGPNGIPFGWVTIRWVEGPWKDKSDQYYDYDLKKAGNKKVGNADPRIASLKAKIQQNKDDIGALKDVHYMAKDMENDLRKRRDDLEKELEEVRKDIEGWREVKDKAEVAWRVAESKKA